MKFKDKYEVTAEFEDVFRFASEEEELEHEAKMIMFRFFNEIENLSPDKIKKADLAKAMHTSASFITQLFKGDKIVNLHKLAQLQKYYGITFEIKAKVNPSKIKTPKNKISARKQQGLRKIAVT